MKFLELKSPDISGPCHSCRFYFWLSTTSLIVRHIYLSYFFLNLKSSLKSCGYQVACTMREKTKALWLYPSLACPQRAVNVCHCRGWGMHRGVHVSFSSGYLGLSDSCIPSSWWLPPCQHRTNQLEVSLALLVHDIQWTQPEVSWDAQSMVGHRDFCNGELGMLLEVEEIEAEDTLYYQTAALRFAAFW